MAVENMEGGFLGDKADTFVIGTLDPMSPIAAAGQQRDLYDGGVYTLGGYGAVGPYR